MTDQEAAQGMERTEHMDPEEAEMNASPPQPPAAEPFDDYEDDGFGDEPLPARPRTRYLTPLTAVLMALILGGVGFFVGIRVEKSKTSSGTGTSAFTGGFPGTRDLTSGGTGASRSSSSASGRSSRFAAAGGVGAAGGFGGAGGATVGSVSSVNGNTIYVKETNGNTVKVKLSSATKVTKSQSVSRRKLNPGDSVVIEGSAGSNGTVEATSVSDSGAAGSSSSASSSSGSSSSASTSSAINSLFGS